MKNCGMLWQTCCALLSAWDDMSALKWGLVWVQQFTDCEPKHHFYHPFEICLSSHAGCHNERAAHRPHSKASLCISPAKRGRTHKESVDCSLPSSPTYCVMVENAVGRRLGSITTIGAKTHWPNALTTPHTRMQPQEEGDDDDDEEEEEEEEEEEAPESFGFQWSSSQSPFWAGWCFVGLTINAVKGKRRM